RDAKCYACGTSGHISKVCKKRNMKNFTSSSTDSSKATRRDLKVGFVRVASCATSKTSTSRIYADILIDDKPLRIQYDSGSDITILSRRDHRKIGSPLLIKSTVRARTADSKSMKLDGCFAAAIRYMDSCKVLQIHVADIPDSLLGLDYCDNITFLPSTPADTFVAKVSSCCTPTSTTVHAAASCTATSSINATSPASTSKNAASDYVPASAAYIPASREFPAVTQIRRGDRVRHFNKDFDAWLAGNVIENFNGMVTIKSGTHHAMLPVNAVHLVQSASSRNVLILVPVNSQADTLPRSPQHLRCANRERRQKEFLRPDLKKKSYL
uniref:CCHC-type domain-containing protein n=1 Tax=Panagrolaimus sp. ES5 TaxID=591445 RepID=A0AC34FXG1_9BILA